MSDISDMIAWLRGVLDEDERIANALDGEGWNARDEDAHGMRRVTVNYSTETVVACTLAARGEHIARHDPAAVIADIAAKRALLAELAGWIHTYVDGDTWFSCGMAEDPGSGAGPGSGCSDEDRCGICDCGLEARQMRIIAPFTTAYAGRPGYRAEWRPAS